MALVWTQGQVTPRSGRDTIILGTHQGIDRVPSSVKGVGGFPYPLSMTSIGCEATRATCSTRTDDAQPYQQIGQRQRQMKHEQDQVVIHVFSSSVEPEAYCPPGASRFGPQKAVLTG